MTGAKSNKKMKEKLLQLKEVKKIAFIFKILIILLLNLKFWLIILGKYVCICYKQLKNLIIFSK